MPYELKSVQIRSPRPFNPKAVGRVSRYCRDDGSDRSEILYQVLIGLDYDLECMAASIRKLFTDKIVGVSEVKDFLRSAILILEALLASSVFIKIFSSLREPLLRLLTALKSMDKILNGLLESFDVCADFLELLNILERGN
jgi:hypothetical protein